MSEPADPSAAPDSRGFGAWWRDAGVARAIRLSLFAAAVIAASLAYRGHLNPNAPWTAWLWQLALGVALLVAALWEGEGASSGRLRWAFRIAGAAVAIAGGWFAVTLAPERGRELEAGIALIAALLGFLVFRWRPFVDADVRDLTGGDPTPRAAPMWRIAALAFSAVAVAAAAMVWNPTHHELGFALWLASMALFAGAFWQRGAASRAERWQVESGAALSPGGERLALFLILVFAWALRSTVLDAVPAWVNPDEGRLGRYAERMWADGFPNAFGLGWNGFPHLSYMVHYAWVQVLGASNPHLRLSAATIGVLSLMPAFYWMRLWWGNVVALIGVFLLAINQTHLLWSRIAFNNMHQVLVAALILLCFARLLRRRLAIDWVWLGFAAGLAFHTYHAAKLFPLLLVPIGVLLAIGITGFARRYLPGLAIGVVAFALCLGPLIRTTVEGWDFFYLSTSNRVDVGLLVDAYRAGEVQYVRDYLDGHVRSSLYAFTAIPTPADAYLTALVAVPFALGVGWMLWRWRDPRHLTVLVWVAGILGAGMITDYPPATTRMLGILPAVCAIPAIVAGRLRALLGRWRWGDSVFGVILIAWLAVAAHATWYQFFVVAPPLQAGQPMSEICRVIRRAPLPSTLYMVGGDAEAELTVAQNDCMIAADARRRLVNPPRDAAVVPLPPDHVGDAIILVSHLQRELAPLIGAAYPEARHTIVHDRAGLATLQVFDISQSVIERHRGLRAEYRSASGHRLSDQASPLLAPPADAEFPALVIWRGSLFIPEPGQHELRTSAGELRIGDRLVGSGAALRLAAGWHAIEIAAELTATSDPAVLLEWRRDGAWAPIPPQYLHDQTPRGGLLGRYFSRAIESASAEPLPDAADYESIEPALSFRYRAQSDDEPPVPFAALPSTMEWSGSVDFDGRPRRLRLEATTPTRVFLDGELVIDLPRDGRAKEVDLPATEGRVPLLVRNVRPQDDDWRYWELRLLWREPGGDWGATAGYE